MNERRHKNHHRLIAERWQAAETATGHWTRIEAIKRATWTTRDHIRTEHGTRTPFTIARQELEALHASLHRKENQQDDIPVIR